MTGHSSNNNNTLVKRETNDILMPQGRSNS